jgi:hypothetical protein
MMNGGYDVGAAVVIMLGLFLLFILFVASVTIYSVSYLDKSIKGWRRTGRILRFSIEFIVISGVVIFLGNYSINAYRRLNATDCQKRASTIPPYYVAELCSIGDGDYVGRVYDSHHTKIAETTFDTPGVPRLSWFNDGVDGQTIFLDDVGAGMIHLPPTWLDRIRARLP